jgi:hypothetical protein
MPNPNADRLDDAVAELVEHGHDDLPDGAASPLGGEARPNLLKTRPEAEIRRLAKLGKMLVDERVAARSPHAG